MRRDKSPIEGAGEVSEAHDLATALGRELGSPIDFGLAALPLFKAGGFPTRVLAAFPEGFVLRSSSPALVDVAYVAQRGEELRIQVIHRKRKPSETPLVRHRAEALRRLERGLIEAATLTIEEQPQLIQDLLQSASSAMQADAVGRLSVDEGFTRMTIVRGGLPGLGKRR